LRALLDEPVYRKRYEEFFSELSVANQSFLKAQLTNKIKSK